MPEKSKILKRCHQLTNEEEGGDLTKVVQLVVEILLATLAIGAASRSGTNLRIKGKSFRGQ
jgi:hypothetical protein